MDYVTIFHIWQFDLKPARNRLLDALRDASDELSIEGERIVAIDRNKESTTGAVTIDHVLLRQIEQADVVVADITPVAEIPLPPDRFENDEEFEADGVSAGDGEPSSELPKATPNPNVMFEVGYAIKALGPERVILFHDTEHCVEGRRPFDIQNRASIMTDSKRDLTTKLVAEIEQILASGPQLPASKAERNEMIRLLDAGQSKKKQQAVELELLAGSSDDMWARTASYFKGNSVQQWNQEWLYGATHEIAIRDDLRTVLLQSSNPLERSEAAGRVSSFLSGAARWSVRRALIAEATNKTWLPKVGAISMGRTHPAANETNTNERAEWLSEVAELGFNVSAARSAHDALKAVDPGDDIAGAVDLVATTFAALVAELQTTDPTMDNEVPAWGWRGIHRTP